MNERQASAAVEALYDSHYALLVSFAARYTGSLDLAEDVVQDAFLQLYRELREGRPIENAVGWAVCVVRRQARQALLRRQKLQPLSEDHLPAGESAGMERSLDAGRLRDLIETLSEREAEVLVLRLGAMKYREIAEQLDITTSSVNTLLLRALKKLRRAMKESVFDLRRMKRAADAFPETLQ